MNTDKDKFGYYQVGQFKTYSKIEAIELHVITGIHPEWRFNDLAFGSYDWTIEPWQDLSELYAKRARQIRNQYDYVVIFFSGGADSFNIVNTFIKNKIPFEELATYHYAKADSHRDSYFNVELERAAFPQIKKWKEMGINFVHRDIDTSESTMKIIADNHYRTNRVYYSNHLFGNNNLARSYIRETEPDYQRIIESGRRLVFVWGADKPRIYKENDRLCLKFLDLIDTTISSRTQMLSRDNEHDELFYWSPDAMDVMCKQAHILRRFIIEHKVFDKGIDHSDYRKDDNIRFTRDFESSFRNLINHLIYPDWDINTFSQGKAYSMIDSPRDVVFNKDLVYKQQMLDVITHLSRLDPYWLNDPNNIHKGVKLCISPAYYLE